MKHRGIISISASIAEVSSHGEILARPLKVEEYSLFDIPPVINIEVPEDSYIECLKALKKELNRIVENYEVKHGR